MNNKKAIEHPQEVIRMLFVALLLIFNIVIIYNFMSDLEVNNSYRVDNLKYNALAARIIYSSDCYAATDSYDMNGETRNRVRAGVVDLGKFAYVKTISNCIKHGEYIVNLKNLDTGADLGTRESKNCDSAIRASNFLVQIRDKDNKLEKGVMRITICV